MSEWFILNPDFRGSAPKTGLFCCRCQKPLKQHAGQGMRSVTVNWDTWEVKNDPLGKDLIGDDCWRVITKSSNGELSQ